jgi:AcrR family transcriptional regulator
VAGFSPASLYEYFDSRAALVAALASRASESLGEALRGAVRGTRAPKTALLRIGLAYVAWARAHPEEYRLLFDRLPSRRTTLRQQPGAESPYRTLLDTVASARNAGQLVARGPHADERIAYGFWALAHGLSMLQLTHLARFEMDFEAADRAALSAFIEGHAP